MDAQFLDEAPAKSGLDPLALLRKFRRRKWLFIVPFILCLTMAGVAIKTMTPIYYSSGQIRVVIEESVSNLINTEYGRGGYRMRGVHNDVLNRIETYLTSPKFLESVVQDLGLHRDEVGIEGKAPGTENNVLSPAEQRAIRRQANQLRHQIRVESASHLIFDIGVRDTDPQAAYLLAKKVLDRFLEEDRANRMARSVTTREFLQRQRETYQKDLEQAENRLTQFQRDMLSANLAGNPINYENVAAAEESLERLRSQYRNEDAQQVAQLEQDVRQILTQPPAIARYKQDSEIAPVVRELQELEFEQLLVAPGQRDYVDRSNELGRLRIRLNGLIDNRVALDYPQIGIMERNTVTRYLYFQIYRDVQQELIDRLQRSIRDFREFSARQPEQSARLNELQQRVTEARNLLTNIEREITRVTLNLEASQSEIGYRIEVRRDPVPRWSPVEPDKRRLAMMGFVLSAAIGMGLVALSILLDRSFTAVEEIERTLGLPVIGTLPMVQDEHFERKRRLRVLRWAVLVVAILAVAAVGFLYVYPRFV